MVTCTEYVSMISLSMETYGVSISEAEDELLTGFGIAKPEHGKLIELIACDEFPHNCFD